MTDAVFTSEEERILCATFEAHLSDGHLDGDVSDEAWDESFYRALDALAADLGPIIGDPIMYQVALGAVLADGREHEEEELIDATRKAIIQCETPAQRERDGARMQVARVVFLACLAARKGLGAWCVGADGRVRWSGEGGAK